MENYMCNCEDHSLLLYIIRDCVDIMLSLIYTTSVTQKWDVIQLI